MKDSFRLRRFGLPALVVLALLYSLQFLLYDKNALLDVLPILRRSVVQQGQHYSVIELNRKTSASRDEITIRANIVDNDEYYLEKFLSHYSECQAVANIHLLPPSSSEKVANTKTVRQFKKVRWLRSEWDLVFVNNRAVLLLDSDLIVTCSDLEFAYSVWLSAQDSAVGFFPRLVLKDSTGTFEYLGPLFVWWQGVYTLLSPSGMLISKDTLESLLTQRDKASKTLRRTATDKPSCAFLSLSVWSVYKKPTPVWVEVDVSYLPIQKSTKAYTERSFVKSSECIGLLAKALEIDSFDFATYKSARAKHQLFW